MLEEKNNNGNSNTIAPSKIIKKEFSAKNKKVLKDSSSKLKYNLEYEKNKSFMILEIIEYIPNSVVIKTIINKNTGNVTVSSFDAGEVLTETTTPFDNFIQVIDGKAEIVINGKSNLLDTGQSIIIPAHTSNIIKANTRFKIISTIIKSAYDDVPS